MSVIKTEHLNVGYDKKTLISDICLEAHRSQVITIIGPNGAGKSTILKTIIKQLSPVEGVVVVGEKSLGKMTEKEIAKEMSVVMTGRLKPELLTCRDVVATGRYPYTGHLGILSKEDWDMVDQSMEMVHATETAQQDFMKISDGQKQRVLLARAICQDTGIMILDEPTSYLDIRYKLDIMESIRHLAKEKNKTVIMSLHELDLARMISDIIVCVDGEKICKIGSPEEIFQGNIIQSLYHIEKQSFEPTTGAVYMEKTEGEPKVFVLGGGAESLRVYSYLSRQQIPFATGLIWENDIAYPAAKAMANAVFSGKKGCLFDEDVKMQAKEALEKCKWCVCTNWEFGPLEKDNQYLYELAAEQQKQISEEALWQK